MNLPTPTVHSVEAVGCKWQFKARDLQPVLWIVIKAMLPSDKSERTSFC